jgi:hypothetical protein
MGRSALAVMALVVCSRLVLADSVAHRALERGFASPRDALTTLALSLGHATTFEPKVPATRRAKPVGEEEQRREPGETSLDDLTSNMMTGFEPGHFDGGGDAFLGGIAPEGLDAALVDANGEPDAKFDWPDLSGVVELLVAQSSRELVAKFRLPGHECPAEAKKRKKDQAQEQAMSAAKCRRTPRSPVSQSFHILAATFIGIFLIIVVLRRSGKGAYWW